MHGLSDDKKIASLWGGVVPNMRYGNRRSNVKPNVLAVLITGSIKTWSIVVDKKGETQEQIEKKLKLFKKQVKLQKHSVGFIFGCNIENNVNNLVKVELFNKIFPKVPLVGCLDKCMSTPYNFDINGRLRKHNCSVTYMILTYDL